MARGLVESGVRRLVVAGGETSGAVVQTLGVARMAIGPQIDPGVPWTAVESGVRPGETLHLAEHLRRKLTVEEGAIAKLHATEELGRSLDELLQLHGGYGYMMEHPIARAFVDSRVNRIKGGTSEVVKELISRHLGAGAAGEGDAARGAIRRAHAIDAQNLVDSPARTM